ncbi:MAG: beta-lactamase family protein [Clostridia bacterium]|nr:beta-lactamase family protein [Clostridia bacterium]
MKHWGLYRLALRLIPPRGALNGSTLPGGDTRSVLRILRKHRCLGASLCVFDERGVSGVLTFGFSHLPDTKARADTVFRAASVSKFITALGAMKLREAGRLDLDADVNAYLPFSLRHPKAPETPITLRMLLSHTAGIHDGTAYNRGVAKGTPLSALLQGDSFSEHLPGRAWEYSNFGAGIAGAVMEAAAGTDFETLMQETVFEPLQVRATFYPQKVRGDLADAVRILPRQRTPNYDAAERRTRPMPEMKPDCEHHYNLAHGALCVTAEGLSKLGLAGMKPGFLKNESLREMRKEILPFGERAKDLSQGVGTFILRDPSISARPLYGHQGMAYGAVHGVFFEPESARGVSLLTLGASEARDGVLADLNRDLLRALLGDRHG